MLPELEGSLVTPGNFPKKASRENDDDDIQDLNDETNKQHSNPNTYTKTNKDGKNNG